MDLTPIKIRGKKDRARRRPSIDSLPPQHPDYTTKRPFVPSPGSRISSAKIPRQLAARTNTISVLEQLPTELLDNIFFFCLNISLPQASPILGRKLASHHVKSQLVLQVLSASSGDEYPVPLSYIIPTLPQHADLQSRILRLRWMTPPFLQSLIPEYIVTTVLREFPKRSLLWRGKEHVDDKSGPMILESLKDNESLQDVWYGHNAEISQLTVSKYDGVIDYRAGWLKHQQNGATSPRNLTAEETGNSAHWRIFCGIAGCQIPEKILHGPWTEEKCDFLELLIRGNASIDWVRSTTGEVAERGLVDALREGNARAVKSMHLSTAERDCDSPLAYV